MDEQKYNNKNCPVSDLLHLIQQDDIEQLQHALLEVIDDFQPSGEIYLYEQGYGIFDSGNRKFSPRLLTSRGELSDVIEKSDDERSSNKAGSIEFDGFKYLPTENYVQVFTIEDERSSRGLLITVNSVYIDEKYVDTLIRVYNNQAQLLRNKDTDSLTRLFNRKSLDTKLLKLHKNLNHENRVKDTSSQYYFALFDIDLFKNVNDKFGHVYGDEVLLLFAKVMKSTFREIDLLFRYGGEEFAILLNNVTLLQADNILNRFRKNVEDYLFPLENKITTSIGYCLFTNEVALPVLIQRADKALYFAKENGRNQLHSFELLLSENKISNTSVAKGEVEIF